MGFLRIIKVCMPRYSFLHRNIFKYVKRKRGRRKRVRGRKRRERGKVRERGVMDVVLLCINSFRLGFCFKLNFVFHDSIHYKLYSFAC